ncbi:hypothetical protein TRICI_004781 [Trichomonascus ciferrii]|uniref:Uncharacterized protein n=1 Tax=Trichomonascus ciferrii TaxID=44093 RepID=A0A642V5T6_9ASCO|nr:hypothetical protein TRICI_004781 [Trichomonascus ciferrii]
MIHVIVFPPTKSLSQRVHDAILNYASNTVVGPPARIDLPAYVKQIEDPERRFRIILEDDIALPNEHLLDLYESLHGDLTPRSAALFSIYLYKSGYYGRCCEVLLENLSLGGQGDILNVLSRQVIPTLCQEGPLQFDSRSLVVGNMLNALVVELGQPALALQLCHELGIEGAVFFSDLERIRRLREDRGQVTLGQIRREFQQPFAEVLRNEGLPLWTRLQVLDLVLTSYAREMGTQLNAASGFLSKPFVIQGLIRNYLILAQREVITQQEVETFSRAIGAYISRDCKYALHPRDLEALCQLGTTKDKFARHWKYVKKHYDRHDIVTKLNDNNNYAYIETLTVYLQHAIRLQESYDIVNIIQRGQGKFPALLLARAIERLAWARRKRQQEEDDEAMYYDPKDVDTRLLDKTLAIVPENTRNQALSGVFARLQKRPVVPGRILWNLILGIQKSGVAVNQSLERRIADALARRPHFEQMHYMSLPMSSPAGIMHLLKQYIWHMKRQRNPIADNLGTEADAKLLVAGITLIDEKQAQQQQTVSASLSKGGLATLVVALFKDWQGERAARVVEELYSQKIQPSDEILVPHQGQLQPPLPGLPTNNVHDKRTEKNHSKSHSTTHDHRICNHDPANRRTKHPVHVANNAHPSPQKPRPLRASCCRGPGGKRHKTRGNSWMGKPQTPPMDPFHRPERKRL